MLTVDQTTIVFWFLGALSPLLCAYIGTLVAIPWFICFAYYIYYQLFNKEYLQANGRVVYITGCDTGFGHVTALQLADRGCYVFAGCLRPLEATDLHAHHAISVMHLDVTNSDTVEQCAQQIQEYCDENRVGLWGLFNNAGIAMAGEIEWQPIDQYRRIFEVNVFGTLAVTKSVLPLVRRSKGRVVTITSGISRSVLPGRSSYCMTKAALEAMSDCLRYEMHKFGVKCMTIAPGNFVSATNVFQGLAGHLDKTIEGMDPQIKSVYGEQYLQAFRDSVCSGYVCASGDQSAEPVVDAVIDALFMVHPRPRYNPATWDWLLWWRASDILPTQIIDWIMFRKVVAMPANTNN